MSKIAYRDKLNFRPKTRAYLDKVEEVVERYQAKNLRLTVRRLFYQLVAAIIIENTRSEYRRLSRILTEARMCRRIDWDAIEDGVRETIFPNQFSGMAHGIQTLISAYRLDRWEGQHNYVEVVVEKNALIGVLEPIANKFHVHLTPNIGYDSTSAIHELSLRLGEAESRDMNCVVLYFGDHDPSGQDMVRDMDDRLAAFGCTVEVRKVALTLAQVRQYNLPPNQLKRKDPRARRYASQFGNESWELDALPPDVLNSLLRTSIESLLDRGLFDQIIQREEDDKKRLKNFTEKS